MAEVPAEVVVTNHAMGLYELAAIHLSAAPPDLAAAALAIDAFACLVEGLGDRLGPDVATLRDALAQIRMAFVQIKQSAERRGSGRRADRSSGPVGPPVGPVEAADGAATTRPPRTTTPSERRRPACRASWPGTRRPFEVTTRHHGTARPWSARMRPTARARPGNPASSATSP